MIALAPDRKMRRHWEPVVFAVLALLGMIVMTPGVLLNFRTAYHITFALGLAAVLWKKKLVHILISRYFFPITICFIVYSTMYVLHFAAYTSVLTFVRGSMFFVFGFSIAANPRYLRQIILWYCLFLLCMASVMQGGVASLLHAVDSRDEFWVQASNNLRMSVIDAKEEVTNFVWHISFAAVILGSFRDQSPKKYWPLLTVMGIGLTILVFCSAILYMSSLLILMAGLLGLGVAYAHFNKRFNVLLKIRNVTIAVIGFILVGFIISRILASFTSADAGALAHRYKTLVSMVSTGNVSADAMDSVTSGRSSILSLSTESFAQHPIIGTGDDRASEVNVRVSGHSSAIDVFARYGLLGGLPVLFLFIVALRTALVAGRFDIEYPWTMASCMAFLAVYALSMFWNPIFLTAISEVYFFLVFGFVSGRHAFHSAIRAARRRHGSPFRLAGRAMPAGVE